MNRHFCLLAALLVAALLPFSVVQAETMLMEKAAYKAGKIRVGAESKAAQTACGETAGKARDFCVERARAKEALDRAELRYDYTGTAADQTKLFDARAESAQAEARAKPGKT